MGRRYDPVVDLVQPLTGDADNYDNSLRVSNSAKYVSPTMRGVTVEALYAFGGTAGSVGDGQTYSAAVSFTPGPLALAAGYFYANGGTAATNGVRTWTSSSDPLFGSVVTSGLASAKST